MAFFLSFERLAIYSVSMEYAKISYFHIQSMPDCSEKSTRLNNCLANVSIHEFGHRLGLHHEMGRYDIKNCDGSKEDYRFGGVYIGRADEKSVMNYCHLYASDDANIAMKLSEGDKATIQIIRSGLFAHIDSMEHRFDRDFIEFKVNARKIAKYRFKFNRTPCDVLEGYSEWRSVSVPLTGEDFKAAISSKGDILCLLGADKDGNQQDLKQFSSYHFEMTVAPRINGLDLPREIKAGTSFENTYTVESAAPLSSISFFLSPAGKSEQWGIPTSFVQLSETQYKIKFDIRADLSAGEYVLNQFTITDKLGNRGEMELINKMNRITVTK